MEVEEVMHRTFYDVDEGGRDMMCRLAFLLPNGGGHLRRAGNRCFGNCFMC